MSHFNLASAGPLRSSNLGTIETQRPQQASALDLPGEQKFALVYLRKAGPDSLAAKIIPHLNETGIPFPTCAHWHALAAEGYVTREPSGHRLTPKGNGAAETVMRDLARKFSVCHITIRPKLPRYNMGAMASCACGGWHKVVGRADGEESRLRRLAAQHLHETKTGTFKKPRPIEDFLNEVMPPRLPFSGPAS